MTQSRRPHPRTRPAHAPRTAPTRPGSPRRAPQQGRRPARRRRRPVAPLVVAGVVAVCVVGALAWGVVSLVGALSGAVAPTGADERPIVTDAAVSGPGEIVIGLNGDEDTYVLVGEEYLEAGAHAAEPADGVLNDRIEVSGEVDTSKPGDYDVTYRVRDSSGHEAQAVRTVHVVDEMETMDGGVPILMYHYVYSADNPPAALDGNYLLDTKLEEQLAYLVENDFYFPSYPELKAFLEGEHSLPARSVVLTFDDAEAGFLDVGIPILEKYRVPATSFVICSDADAAQKIVDHRSPYVSFQSHSYGLHQAGGTVGHGGLISALTTDQIVEDLTHAQKILGATEAFAYPFGDVTADGQQAVRDAGILCAFTTQNSWAHVGDDVTALPRVRISGEYELAGYVSLVNG